MSRHRNLFLGLGLILAGILGLTLLSEPRFPMTGMMMGGMMDRESMQEMMKAMMGAQLPPGVDPDDLPDSQSDGARLLVRYCAQCHDLPSPGMHTAQEWLPVVDRMNRRMQMMGGRGMMRMMPDIQAPTDHELRVLVVYLQQNAQKPIDKTQ